MLQITIFVAWLCVFLLNFAQGHWNGTYTTTRADLQGRSYYYQIIEANFPDELYLLHQGVCPCQDPSSQCNATTIPDTSSPSLEVTTLVQGEWLWVNGTVDVKLFKFVVGKVDGPCPVVVIAVDNTVGRPPDLVVSIGEPPRRDNQVATAFYYLHRDIFICQFKFAFGTYFVEAAPAWDVFTAYKIKFYTMDPLPCIPPSPVPYPSDGSFEWLQDGIPTYSSGAVTQTVPFRFFVNQQCANITASVSKLSNIGDVDITLDLSQSFPSGKLARWNAQTNDDDHIAISFCHQNTSWVIYVGVSIWFGMDVNPFVVVITTRTFNPRPLTDFTYNKITDALNSGSASLHCPDFTELCNFPPYLNCQFDLGNFFGCCHSLFSITPTLAPNPIFPRNRADIDSYTWVDNVPWNEALPIEPKKLSWALYLGFTTPTSVHYKYSKVPDLSQCEIRFNNLIVFKNGTALDGPLKLTPKVLSCDVNLYNQVNDNITDIVDAMNGLEDLTDLRLFHVKIAILNFGENMVGCQNVVLDRLSETTLNNTFQNVTSCLEDVPDIHNCCPLSNSLDACCIPHDYEEPKKVYNIESPSSTCIDKKSNDFSSQFNVIGNCGSEFENSLQNKDPLKKFIGDCRNSIVGTTASGKPCEEDSDCLTSCNPITKLCEHNDTLVLECFAKNIDLLLMRIVRNFWGSNETSTDRSTFVKTFEQYLIKPLCFGPTGIKYQDHYGYASYQYCNDCPEPICYDTSCAIPQECLSSPCPRYWNFVRGDPNLCLSEKSCNWFDCAKNPENCSDVCLGANLTEYVCLDCSNGGHCVEVLGFNESMCSQGLCSVQVYSGNECLSQRECSAPCPNCTQVECEKLGTCSDTQQLLHLISKWNTTDGICITDLHNYYSIAYCYDPEALFSYGCGDNQLLSESSCIENGGIWRKPAFTERDCLSFKINNSTLGAFSSRLFSFIRVPLDEGLQCGLIIEPYVTWTKATWNQPKIQQLIWTKRSYNSTNQFKDTIDYPFFGTSIDTAIGNLYSYIFVNDALCRYVKLNALVSDIVCLMEEEDCDTEPIPAESAVGIACSDIGSTILNDFAEVHFFPDSLPDSATCNTVTLFTVSSSNFQSTQPTKLSSEIFKPTVPNVLSVVKNGNGVIVGQMVSDGLTIEMNNGTVLQSSIQLCFNLKKNYFLEVESYKIYGIGHLKDKQIFSLDSSQMISDEKFCSNITFTGTFFGIKMVENWDKILHFSEGEAWASIAIYSFVLIVTIVQFILLILFDQNILFKGWNMVLQITFLSTRVAYVSLFDSDLSSSNVPLFLFEFPTILFFLIYLCVLYLWLNVLAQVNMLSVTKVPLLLYVTVSCFISLLFIVFVIIFYNQPEFYTLQPCDYNSLLYTSIERSTTNLVYESIIACLSLLLAFLFIIIGAMFLHKMTKFPNISTSYKRLFYTTQFLMTCFAVCFTIRTVLTVVSLTSHYVASLVGFTILEALPCLLLTLYLYPPDTVAKYIRTKRESSHSRQQTGTGGRNTTNEKSINQ